jgi:hypothetical protein
MSRYIVQEAKESGADEGDWLPSVTVEADNDRDAVGRAGEHHAGYRVRAKGDESAPWTYWVKTLDNPPDVVPGDPPFLIKPAKRGA